MGSSIAIHPGSISTENLTPPQIVVILGGFWAVFGVHFGNFVWPQIVVILGGFLVNFGVLLRRIKLRLFLMDFAGFLVDSRHFRGA